MAAGRAAALLLLMLHLAAALQFASALATLPEVAPIQLPPLITKHPPMQVVAAPGDPLRLDCAAVASGLEPLTYWWRRNGVAIGNITTTKADKSNAGAPLYLASPSLADEGDYQCFASNSLGTAVTVKTSFRLASLASFPRVSRTATLMERLEGDSLRLPCRPPASLPPATVMWHRIDDGAAGRMSTLPVSNRVAIDPTDGSLLFANLLPSDGNARYQCGARNDVVRRTVEGAAYRLLVRPNDGVEVQQRQRQRPAVLMAQSESRPVLLANQTVADLFCFFAGLPTPTISWTRSDGSPLEMQHSSSSAPLFRLLESNTRLQLLGARADKHTGGYRCIGEVGDSSTSSDRSSNSTGDFHVSVASPPSWLEAPANAVVAEGESHSVACRTSASEGLPRWFVNGQPSELDGRAKRVGQRLLFANLSREDSLVVQCNSSNRHGYVFANAYLRVVWEPPVITRPPGRLMAAAGAELRIPCRTFAAPKPTVTWMLDDRPLDDAAAMESGRLEVQDSGDLLIRVIETRDSGTYRCRASNRFGAAAAVGQLTVRRATRITEPPPEQLRVVEGATVRLECEADTDPAEQLRLTVVWKRESHPVEASITSESGSSELKISSTVPADTGVYTCVAANGIDSDSRSTQLIVQGRPSAPSSPTQVDCSAHSASPPTVRLTWPPALDNNSPIQRYTVEFTTQYSSMGDWQPAEVLNDQSFGSDRAFARVRLRPGIEYQFRVRGVNAVGTGDASAVVHAGAACRLAPTRPARHPGGLRVEASSKAGGVAISWQPLTPLEYGGDGLRYLLRISCLDCRLTPANQVNETVVTDAKTSRLELSNLGWNGLIQPVETYRIYQVEIRSANKFGEATSNVPQKATGHSGELPPTVAPSHFRLASMDPTSWSVVELAWSIDRNPARDPRVRGFYRGFRAVWCTVAQLNVTPADGNGCLGQTRFQDFVYRQQASVSSSNSDAEEVTSIEAQPVQFTGRLMGLPGFSNVRTWLHLLNLRFAGPPSHSVDFRTPEGTPGQVGEFVLSLTGASHLEFDWLPPREPNGRVVGYQLSYREVVGLPMGPLIAAPVINDPSQLRGSLTGLSPNTNYRVYIRAQTATGDGEATFLDARTAPPNSAPVSAAASAASAAPVGSQALNVSVPWPPARMRAFYVQYRQLDGSGEPITETWLETQREVRRRWLLIDNLKHGAMFEIRVVMLSGSASAVYTESLRVRTGGSDADGNGLLKGSIATWLGSAALLLLLLLLGTALVFYCLARRRGHQGGRRGGDYHRGKPVATSTRQEAASAVASAAAATQDDCGEFTGTRLHCMQSPQQQFAQRLSPEGAKSYAFTDTSYLTLGSYGNDKSAQFGVAAGGTCGYSTIRGPPVTPVSDFPLSRQTASVYRQATPLLLTQWPLQTNGGGDVIQSDSNGGQATSII